MLSHDRPEKKDGEDEDYATMIQFLSDSNKTTFIHIFLFNALTRGDINEGLNRLCSLHYALLIYQAFLALLQFIGIVLIGSGNNQLNNCQTACIIISFIGFLVSMSGVGISFIAVEYFHGIRGENLKFIVYGTLEYCFTFCLSDVFGMIGSWLLGITVMLLVHNSLQLWCAVLLDCVALAVTIGLFLLHRKIIVNPQRYEVNHYLFRRKIAQLRLDDSRKKLS